MTYSLDKSKLLSIYETALDSRDDPSYHWHLWDVANETQKPSTGAIQIGADLGGYIMAFLAVSNAIPVKDFVPLVAYFSLDDENGLRERAFALGTLVELGKLIKINPKINHMAFSLNRLELLDKDAVLKSIVLERKFMNVGCQLITTEYPTKYGHGFDLCFYLDKHPDF